MIDKIEQFALNILRKIKLNKIANVYEEHKEGMRYLIFGAFTTVVNILVAAFTYYILFARFSESIKVNLSTVVAIIVAWIFAYITNKMYVFDSKTTSIRELLKEIVSFVGCRILTAIVEIVMMNIFVTKLEWNYMITKIIVNIIVIILNYIFSKLFIFKNGKENVENG